jgi:hypothetical protein
MRIAPFAGDSPLWGFATGQSSEFGSNHEQIPAVALQQRQCERFQAEPCDLMAYVEDLASDGSLNKSV